MPKKVFIYCLKDPNTGDVRYIGQTNNLKKRTQTHLSTSSKLKTPLGDWLRSLNGGRPILAVLHEVAFGESWQDEEKRYICFARGMGMDLVNSTAGGQGTPNPSLETRAKRSAAMSGEKHWSFGKPLSIKTRKKIGDRLRGVPLTPSHCAGISLGKQGKKNPMFGKSGMMCPAFNKKRAGASSQFWGVSWRRGHVSSKWQATIRGGRREKNLSRAI